MTSLVASFSQTVLHPTVLRPTPEQSTLTLSDSAIRVMTDFRHERPITIAEDRPIDAALDDMIRFGVRALLVMCDHHVVGLITSYDIQGERPMQLLQRSIYGVHAELRVRDVMTPWDELPVLELRNVQRASVDELLDVFHDVRMLHLLVAEKTAGGAFHVCGMISRTRLERQLNGYVSQHYS